MKLLAFDLGSKTGFAVGPTDGKPVAGTEVLGHTGASHGERFTACLALVKALVKTHKPDAIAIEMPIAAGVKGSQSRVQLAMGYRAAVAMVCFMGNIPFHEYPVQTVRKHFIGTAKMKRHKAKVEVMAQCRLLGWQVDNDEEGDACAAWDCARAKLTENSSLPPGLFRHAEQHGSGTQPE